MRGGGTLRPEVVVGRSIVAPVGLSLGLSLAACAPRAVANPPPPPPPAAPAPPAPPSEPVTSPHEQTRFTVEWNGVDADGRRIHKRSDGACYVFGPWEGPRPTTTAFVPPPTAPVACPPHMDDTWLSCAFGTVQATADGAACLCAVMGNPPAPPRTMPCPTAPPPAVPPIRPE